MTVGYTFIMKALTKRFIFGFVAYIGVAMGIALLIGPLFFLVWGQGFESKLPDMLQFVVYFLPLVLIGLVPKFIGYLVAAKIVKSANIRVAILFAFCTILVSLIRGANGFLTEVIMSIVLCLIAWRIINGKFKFPNQSSTDL